jgi:hypothetical protein
MSDKSKFKIEPKIDISKGSFNPDPEVKVSSQNIYYGIGGEYNLIDDDNTNLKISGNVGKGSGRSDVESSFGKDIFKGEGPIDKNFKVTYTKKFKGGGFIAKGCGKVMGDRRKVTKMY